MFDYLATEQATNHQTVHLNKKIG